MINIDVLLDKAKKGDFVAQHDLGIYYLKNANTDEELKNAEHWLEESVKSNIPWIINDYVDHILSTKNKTKYEFSKKILLPPSSENHHQSIRLLALLIMDEGTDISSTICKILLNYSNKLGNPWAAFDLIKILKDEKSEQSAKMIENLALDSKFENNKFMKTTLFDLYLGKYGSKLNLTKLKELYDSETDDSELHSVFLNKIISTSNRECLSILKK